MNHTLKTFAFTLTAVAAASAAWAQTSPPAPGVQTTSRIDVVGRASTGSYHSSDTEGAKTELPTRELPQAVRVMSRQTLDDLGAVRLDDVLDNAGGVSRQNHFGGLWDNIAIRGFAGDVNNGMALLRDGFGANRGFNAPRDLANVERVEFLKGPVSALYGLSEPGGTINLVTKKPRFKAAHSLEAYVGSFSSNRLALDSTGPLASNLAYRLNVAVEDKGSFRDFVYSKRNFVAPALAWKLSADTQLSYNGEWLEHKTPLDRGVPATNGAMGAVPRERFTGEPADGAMRVNNQTHHLGLAHSLSARWRINAQLATKTGSLYGFSTEPNATLLTDERTLRRQRRFRDYASDDLSWQLEAQGNVAVAGMPLELLLGASGHTFDVSQLMLRINPTAAAPYQVDVFNPVYGQVQPTLAANTDTVEAQRGRSLYAQAVLSPSAQWRVVAGVRSDAYNQTLTNRRTGVVTQQSPNETTPRLGLSYLASAQLTAFVNTGKSFRPNNGLDRLGNAFAPEQGSAAEAGLKWENTAKTMGATLAAYRITKRNVLTPDAANPAFSAAAGEVQSQGVDLDFSGQLSAQWRINASWSSINAKVVRDNNLALGRALLNIPSANASLLLVHTTHWQGIPLGLGGGFTHSSARLGEAYTQAQANAGTPAFELPAYTLAKLTAHATLNATWRATLDVDNAFDRTYYTNSFQRTWVMPGTPRTVTLGVQAKF